MSGLASRLYRGEAGLQIVGRRKLWYSVAAGLVLLALLSFGIRGFELGIEFRGGNEFQIPARIGTLDKARDTVDSALGSVPGDEPASVVSTQQVGGGNGTYLVRTTVLDQSQATAVKNEVASRLGIPADDISDNQVSAAWGGQVTEQALWGLAAFLVLVTGYLVLRFEWRMAVAAVSGLALDLLLTAGVYSIVGFEVTPSTIVGFLTILGFALYDVVVVFDKIQENTRGITAGSTQTYGEAANLAINQTLMRSINTSVVALLPVGGLLFIGAGLLGAGTLKDLGLVLFVGMAAAFFSSIFLATPLVVSLKDREPRIQAHTQRVLAKRAGLAGRDARSRRADRATTGEATDTDNAEGAVAEAEREALAGAAPKVGARPVGKRPGAARGGAARSGGGNRPGGGGKRR